MNKSELVTKVATEAEVSQKTAKTVLDTILASISQSLSEGERVRLFGFGTFSIANRKAREGRIPSNGKKIKIPAKKVAKFSAGGKLSDAVK